MTRWKTSTGAMRHWGRRLQNLWWMLFLTPLCSPHIDTDYQLLVTNYWFNWYDDQVNAISDSSYAHPIDTASKIHFMRSSDPVKAQKSRKKMYFFCSISFDYISFRCMFITSPTEGSTPSPTSSKFIFNRSTHLFHDCLSYFLSHHQYTQPHHHLKDLNQELISGQTHSHLG